MKVTGFWSMEFPVSRFEDLVRAVNKAVDVGVPIDAEVELVWSTSQRESLLVLSPRDGIEGDLIECGNHYADDRKWDVIFPVHECEEMSDEVA